MSIRQLLSSAVVFTLVCCILPARPLLARTTDEATGLIVAPGWELVRANCGGCHSFRLVTAQRGDREYWAGTIRWMQRTQNLWPLPPVIEEPLLDYLSANYNETEWGRRPPLSPTLMPDPPGLHR